MTNHHLWSSTLLPKILPRFPGQMAQRFEELMRDGAIEWRITGGTKLQARPVGGGKPVTLSTTSPEDPVYFKKWKSALRRWGLDAPQR